ncbi:hypothetical protein [Winogradskyella ouciana]|uniref:Uncharacterized protein n=1 Tax=Winogradskyella ouciana TaxID=2608631 RepID=A0A7K1GCF2_9FLAO|nr:hypothetical protein [Winogradskyella ouciana]MTE25539.1 hypothetical protein [Winogradskyella ouciana]
MKIKDSSKKIIKSYNWFGISFYEKKRISESPLQLDFEPVHCEDIGLYVIGKYPRLKYSSLPYEENFNWQHQAIATIRLTILNLINNGDVEIIKVKNKTSYLYKTFPSEDTDYYFKVSDLQLDKDWFSQLVYKTINEVNRSKHPNLFKYVRAILDKIVYSQSTYRKPARAFIIQILRKYTKTHSWIQLDTKSRFLGLLENNSLKVAEIYIPRINMQHQSLTNLDNTLIRNHKDYSHFCKSLHYEIKRDFKRRQPKSN